MTTASFATLSSWSYGVTALAYLAFAGRVAVGLGNGRRGALLLGALVVTSIWSGLAIPLAYGVDLVFANDVASALRYALWYAFIAHLILRPSRSDVRQPVPWHVAAVVIAILLASVVLGSGADVKERLGLGPRIAFALHLSLAIVGLIFIEQMLRRIHSQQRWGVRPLAIALTGVFAFDLWMYADAMLFGRLDADLWVARGFGNLVVIPFIAVATARNSGWTVDLHFSRNAVFHSTALLISGAFLMLVAGAGYLLRYLGGDWGRALGIELVFVGALAVVLVAGSGRFRSRLKVFVSKHFFSYRYDYREEWLRFTGTLASENALPRVQERVIVALADLVESPAGVLWLRSDSGVHAIAARWNIPEYDGLDVTSPSLVEFLERTGWIVSIAECREHPERYGGLRLPTCVNAFPSPWLVIPLLSGSSLLGYVLLSEPRTPIKLDWEVRDLLKTASRQAASYLGEIVASEALLEARKFEAFNRMSAFVVHDLKNLVAQLSLMLKNAERHRGNPQFQADMLSTVKHVVERMNKLMFQLRAGAEPVENAASVDIPALVVRVCDAKANAVGHTQATIECHALGTFLAVGHEDRLEHVVGHLVQNAIDASKADGLVRVDVDADERHVSVVIEDAGTGMTPEFVRDRLFRPFETTKATGMGIGVYESVQYLSRIGGEVQVESTAGVGTRVRVRLPRVLLHEREHAEEQTT